MFGVCFASLFFYSSVRLNSFRVEQEKVLPVIFDFADLTHNLDQIQDAANEYSTYLTSVGYLDNQKKIDGAFASFLNPGSNPAISLKERSNFYLENLGNSMNRLFGMTEDFLQAEIESLLNNDGSGRFLFQSFVFPNTEEDDPRNIQKNFSIYSAVINLFVKFNELENFGSRILSLAEQSRISSLEFLNLQQKSGELMEGVNSFLNKNAIRGLYQLMGDMDSLIIELQQTNLKAELWEIHYAMIAVAVLAVLLVPLMVLLIHAKVLDLLRVYSHLKAWEFDHLQEKWSSLALTFENMIYNERAQVDFYLAFWSSHSRNSKHSTANQEQQNNAIGSAKSYRNRSRVLRNNKVLPSVRSIIGAIFLCLVFYCLSMVIVAVALQDLEQLTAISDFFTSVEQNLLRLNYAYLTPIIQADFFFGAGDQSINSLLESTVPNLTRTVLDNYPSLNYWFNSDEVARLKVLFTGDTCSCAKSFSPERFGQPSCSHSNIDSTQEGLLGFVKYQKTLHLDIVKPAVEDFDSSSGFKLSRSVAHPNPVPLEILLMPEFVDFRLARWQIMEIFKQNFFSIVTTRLTLLLERVTKKMMLIIGLTVAVLLAISIPTFFVALVAIRADLLTAGFAYQIIDLQIVLNNAAIKIEAKRLFRSLS